MTSQDPDTLDRQRRWWHRARVPLRLVDPDADDFASGGLASRVSQPSVRLLLLPADPEAWLLDFDSTFWGWWSQDSDDPTTGQPTRWGYENLPTASAALRAVVVEESHLARYVALYRNGALEFELGEDGTYSFRDGSLRVFNLIIIVGRVRAALHLWTGIRARLGLQGPAELSLALRDTGKAALGGFAEGYVEPRPGMQVRCCPSQHLFIRRELWEWPENDERQLALTFSIGGWLQDAWGIEERRFLAPYGPLQGQFDRSHYRWR